jgi:3-hydroxymyristoyl/3-hydroxydecanoyl-(acyl carrier protein) dehydratase
MPFAVLLEIALQPCGWLAAYVGSALTSEQDLSFRNLGGQATQYLPIGPGTGRLTTKVELTNVSSSGGMIIQHYRLAVHDARNRSVYEGTTYFGFFSKQALADQVGLRDLQPNETPRPDPLLVLQDIDSWPDARLRMIDRITRWDPTGGQAGLGLIEGTKAVDPTEWFFKAHFYQDPVVPGSLGLESMLQLLSAIAELRWGPMPTTNWQSIALGAAHQWTYRGQVIPSNREVTVRVEVTKMDDVHRLLHANSVLFVDGRPIYRMTNLSLQGWGQ